MGRVGGQSGWTEWGGRTHDQADRQIAIIRKHSVPIRYLAITYDSKIISIQNSTKVFIPTNAIPAYTHRS